MMFTPLDTYLEAIIITFQERLALGIATLASDIATLAM
jgi:hypothetical protein